MGGAYRVSKVSIWRRGSERGSEEGTGLIEAEQQKGHVKNGGNRMG